MPLPVFFSPAIIGEGDHVLNEETSKHIIQVLRMQNGEQLKITNGKGYMFLVTIIDDHRKAVTVNILDKTFHPRNAHISVAISLVKNVQRFEWFLEKAVEIGVSDIFPLICARTEKHHFRSSRLHGIMVSAMLQSQQPWLPELHEPQKYVSFMSTPFEGDRFIAHCQEEEARISLKELAPVHRPILLIGPEGDFTTEEISIALQRNYRPVTLGHSRLRTETAGVVGITLLNTFTEPPRD